MKFCYDQFEINHIPFILNQSRTFQLLETKDSKESTQHECDRHIRCYDICKKRIFIRYALHVAFRISRAKHADIVTTDLYSTAASFVLKINRFYL